MPDTTRLLQIARTDLLLSQPFFGSLALRLGLVEDPTCETGWTDGSRVGFNPKWIEELTSAQRKGFLAHEVMHVANLHPWRRDARDAHNWNLATDAVINDVLRKSGIDLPPGGVDMPQFAGQSAEAVYGALPTPPPGGGNGSGQEGGEEDEDGEDISDPGGCGEVRDGNSGQAEPQTEAQWEVAVLQAAMQAKQRGELPAGMERLVNRIKKPACEDLTAALMEFAERSAREDYAWSRPNPRYLPHGLYLPGLQSEQMPPVVAVVDSSGSVSADVLSQYEGALQNVLDSLRPAKLTVLSCDARVNLRAEYVPGEEIRGASYPGGGGTDFRPAMEEAENAEEPPCAVIYLTDLMGAFPEQPPSVPVLWVVMDPSGLRPKAPENMGQTIWLDE